MSVYYELGTLAAHYGATRIRFSKPELQQAFDDGYLDELERTA